MARIQSIDAEQDDLKKGDKCRITYHPRKHYYFQGDIQYGDRRKYDAIVVAKGWELLDKEESTTSEIAEKNDYGYVMLVNGSESDIQRIKKSRNPKRLIKSFVEEFKVLVNVRKYDIDFVYESKNVKNKVDRLLAETCVVMGIDYNYKCSFDIPTPNHVLLEAKFLDQILSHPCLKTYRDQNYWSTYATKVKKYDKYQWARLFEVSCGTITRWAKRFGFNMEWEHKLSITQMETILNGMFESHRIAYYEKKLNELKEKEGLLST